MRMIERRDVGRPVTRLAENASAYEPLSSVLEGDNELLEAMFNFYATIKTGADLKSTESDCPAEPTTIA